MGDDRNAALLFFSSAIHLVGPAGTSFAITWAVVLGKNFLNQTTNIDIDSTTTRCDDGRRQVSDPASFKAGASCRRGSSCSGPGGHRASLPLSLFYPWIGEKFLS